MINKRSSIYELAIFSGVPAFDEYLHVGRPNIGSRDQLLSRINEALDRKWLTNHGPLVSELEKRISEYLQVKHCIAICNATIALEIAIKATELKGEIIVPSFTFIATAHALQWLNITPVFCDIDPLTHNIDPVCAEALVTPNTTGIMGVHVWGRPCDIDALSGIAERHKLKLLFDAAHAFGCSYQGRMIGNFGDLEVFSFHATKFFNTFEGGVIATNDDHLAHKIRLMKNFGFSGYDNVVSLGTNGKMSEISAAMGLTGMESIDDFIRVNFINYQAYRKGLSGIPGVKLIDYDASERSNYQYIIVEVDEKVAKVSRDALVRILQAENVLARRYFYPGCHQMEPYRSLYPDQSLALPNTESLSTRVLSLPTGTAVGPGEIDAISHIIRLVVENAGIVIEKLRSFNEKKVLPK